MTLPKTHRFRHSLTIRAVFTATLSLSAAGALAQSVTPEQLQKALDDANSQLKSSQDRKNELAQENQRLLKQIEDLKAAGDQTRQKLEAIENRAYYMREHYAAWQLFVEANPALRAMWVAYFTGLENVPNRAADLIGNSRWPFTVDFPPVSILTGVES